MGLASNPLARQSAAQFVIDSQAKFTFIAVGSPQGELIAHEVARIGGARGTAFCIGAAIEFITGDQKRAPRWIQDCGLEWAHRLAGNPRRLWRRYLVDGLAIFPIFARWFWCRKRWKSAAIPLVALLAVLGLYRSTQANQQDVSEGEEYRTGILVSERFSRLPPPNLLRPLSADAAAVLNSERSFVSRRDEAAKAFVVTGSHENRARALLCLSQAIYYEADAEPIRGKQAVAQIVLNRVRHPAYPSSVCGVVYEGAERVTGCQFSFTCDGSLQRAMAGPSWANAQNLARSALSGTVFAPVGHATHYHADYVLPYWADSLDKTLQIGRHLFYRLKGRIGQRRMFAQQYSGVEILPAARPAPEIKNENTIKDKHLAALPASQPAPGPATERRASPILADVRAGTLITAEQVPAKSRAKPKRELKCSVSDLKLQPIQANRLNISTSDSC